MLISNVVNVKLQIFQVKLKIEDEEKSDITRHECMQLFWFQEICFYLNIKITVFVPFCFEYEIFLFGLENVMVPFFRKQILKKCGRLET